MREVWLDQLPYEPPLVGCLDCGDPIQPGAVMVEYVNGQCRMPLCPPCLLWGCHDRIDVVWLKERD